MKIKTNLTRLALVYVWSLAAIRLIYMVIGDWKWPIIIPMMFYAVLVLPMIVAWPIAIWSKSKSLLLGCSIVTALTIVLYLPRFNAPQVATSDNIFSVASFNVLGVSDRPEITADIIANADADLVGLQEGDPLMATTLTEMLSEKYPYQWHEPWGIHGMSVLSKYPFERTEFESDTIWVGNTQAVIVDSPYGPIAWANQHYIVTAPFTLDPVEFTHTINWTFDERSENAKETLHWQRTTAPGLPMLITMDFNGTDFSDAYQVLTAGNLSDTWLEVGNGFGFTFPNPNTHPLGMLPFPYLRLDYVLHTPEFRPLSIEELPFDGNSDHLGVLATFEIEQ